MLDVGQIIAGKLRVERILGRGGMGVVAEATHLQLEQRVAVKVMLDRVAGDPDTVERFMREARAAAKLKSEHVCRVSDVGQLESGAPYIVMELLAGQDLAHLLAQAPLSIPTAVDYVLQACIAIGEAHVHGIVHRDLKPANLFLTKHVGGAPLVKVLDFGIAKAPSKADAGITATESVMGSPGYMSPEQLRSSRDVDKRTDIWALGVILYQLVSQRLPFPATSVTELAVKVAMDPPDPLEGDPAFVAIVMRCLEKEPAARFGSVASLAEALAPFGTDSARRSFAVIEQLTPKADSLASTMPAIDVNAKTAAPSPKTVTTLGGAATAYGTVAPTAPPARKRTLVLGGLGLAAAGSIATALLLGGKDTSTGSAPQPAQAPLIETQAPPSPTAETPPAPTTTGAPTTAASATTEAKTPASTTPAPSMPASTTPAPATPASTTPASTTPASTTAANKKPDTVTALVAKFDKAIAALRCREASKYWEDLKYSGASAAVINDDTGPRLNTCLTKQGDALANQKEPNRIRTILIMAEEILEAKEPKGARELVEHNILRGTPDSTEARTFVIRAACVEKNGDVARAHAAKLPTIPTIAACTQNKINLAGKQANEPTPDVPSDWKQQLGDHIMLMEYDETRDLALVVLARQPDEMFARYAATLAYCNLDDAPNARKHAAKLDAANLTRVEKLACSRFNIDLTTK